MSTVPPQSPLEGAKRWLAYFVQFADETWSTIVVAPTHAEAFDKASALCSSWEHVGAVVPYEEKG